jgi:hypothetical protein
VSSPAASPFQYPQIVRIDAAAWVRKLIGSEVQKVAACPERQLLQLRKSHALLCTEIVQRSPARAKASCTLCAALCRKEGGVRVHAGAVLHGDAALTDVRKPDLVQCMHPACRRSHSEQIPGGTLGV